MTGADLIRALLDAELKHPGIINQPMVVHPHGTAYTQPVGHVYVGLNARLKCVTVAIESERD